MKPKCKQSALFRRVLGALSLSLPLLAATPATAEVVVIVGAKSGGAAIPKEQVSDIFMGKSSSLGGASVVLVDQPESSPLREEFYTKVAGKSAAQVKAYWSKLAFTGKGTPPKEAGDGAEVKKMVASTPGGIGYIDKSAVDDSVKVVFSH